ncbi:unnamed protein product, partial [marine sediment metagenome]
PSGLARLGKFTLGWLGKTGNFILTIFKEYSHWVAIFTLILIFLEGTLLKNRYIFFGLVFIVFFFFLLGFIYPYQHRVIKILGNARNTVFKGIISTYSMLSGSKLKYNQAVYCSRCLRGVEYYEFESLKEIKNTPNPPCPFCSFTNWIIPSEEVPFREKITHDFRQLETIVQSSINGFLPEGKPEATYKSQENILLVGKTAHPTLQYESSGKSNDSLIRQNGFDGSGSQMTQEPVVTEKTITETVVEPLTNEMKRS